MKRKTVGKLIFAAGILLMMASIITGKYIIPVVEKIGFSEFIKDFPITGKFMFSFFSAAFPFGAAVTVIGAAIFAKAEKKKQWMFFLAILFASILLSLIPEIVDKIKGLWFYGLGSIAILVIFSILTWYWAKDRIKLSHKEQHVSDLRMVGYLFFVIAAWELCGVGSIPFFTFYPSGFEDYDSIRFIVNQSKLVLVFLLIGWAAILAGYIYQHQIKDTSS